MDPLKEFFETLFVPDMNAVAAKFDELIAKYGFVQSIIDSGKSIGSIFTDSVEGDLDPPVIYMDLSAAEGDYYFGEKVAVLDMSWYARYKATVDQFLSAMIWGFFLWRLFIHAPSIIEGTAVSFDFGSPSVQQPGLVVRDSNSKETGISRRR